MQSVRLTVCQEWDAVVVESTARRAMHTVRLVSRVGFGSEFVVASSSRRETKWDNNRQLILWLVPCI